MINIHTQLVGQPQTMIDERGKWRSAICRTPVSDPVYLQPRGLAGDQVADTNHHGSPGQAVCCHPLLHYEFWNNFYGLVTEETRLGPGSVGENWTLSQGTEEDFAVGDIFEVGEAVVQVSGPRYPCTKQERKLKLLNFYDQTKATLHTGFYLRVLTPGLVQAGDELRLVERPYPAFTVHQINKQAFQEIDEAMAQQLLAIPELAAGWRKIIERKLREKPL